jgi:hypothetical protein
MRDSNDFWLHVHRLAESYDSAGPTSEERTQHIVGQFEEMASLAQPEVLHELCRLLVHLPDVYTVVSAAATEHGTKRQASGGQRSAIA